VTIPRRIVRRGRRFGQRGQRSPTDWDGTTVLGTLPANSKVVAVGFAPVAGVGHETVVRIVGSVQVTATTAGTTDGVVLMAAAVVSDTAFNLGATAVPDAITDSGDDMWTFIRPFHFQSGATPTRNEDYDSRGMRKVEEGQTLAIILSSGPAATVAVTKFIFYMRVLFKHGVRS